MRIDVTNMGAATVDGEERQLRLRRRIEAFPVGSRTAVERLASQSPAIEDLADSFPALLFALATDYGSSDARRQALKAVVGGMPLKEAARRLGLPFWMRKLPAVAFSAPIVTPPTDPNLGQRLVDLAPTTPGIATCWLERVMVAHNTGHPELALWTAQQFRTARPAAQSLTFLNVLAWAWFSIERSHPAATFITARWSPNIGAKRALEEARLWQERLSMSVCLGKGLNDTWLQEGEIDGLHFIALRTAQDFICEAHAMDNCLDRYADRLAGRTARVFSIRRDGQSIANIEIVSHEQEKGHPTISQLRGPHNRRAPLEIWQTAYKWLGSQPLRLADETHVIKLTRATRLRRHLALRKPFLDALPAYVRDAFVHQSAGRPLTPSRRPTTDAAAS